MSTSSFRAGASALITGGASGIGYAVAELCLKHGMKVTIADFNDETLDLAKKNLKDVTCLKMDVGNRDDWKRAKQEVGDVDFLMLNAGVGGQGSWGDEEYFDKVCHARCAMSWLLGLTKSEYRRFSTRTSTA
jgi:NADP-dependent 3-hydroxy acid dehydrogenase YdfG